MGWSGLCGKERVNAKYQHQQQRLDRHSTVTHYFSGIDPPILWWLSISVHCNKVKCLEIEILFVYH